MILPARPVASLIYGELSLILSGGLETAIKLRATSGLAGFQYQRSWLQRQKGPLPPTNVILQRARWVMSCDRYWLPKVRGVEGSFYALLPYEVQLGSITRGDFGIHYDANVPGSAGCIVIPDQPHWDAFRTLVAQARNLGTTTLPLEVRYPTSKVAS